jgi:hypothetical protein
MDRRELLGALGMGAAGLIVPSGREARAQQHPHHHDKLHGECLKACEACATVCNETFHHCFHQVKDGHADHHPTAILAIDCQEFCGLASEVMARESPLIPLACLACADACKICGAECSKHDDPQMKECAAACKACEAACRAMAKAIGESPAKHEAQGR